MLKMMSKTTLVALALACVLSGCEKSDREQDSPAPEGYMKDKAFMGELDRRKDLRDKLLAQRVKIDEELSAEKAKDPNSERVKDLQKRLDACDAEFDENRKQTYEFVRARLLKEKDGGKK